eukprot:scaffold120185_cov17-Tisochrysis_lutea.AAC.2
MLPHTAPAIWPLGAVEGHSILHCVLPKALVHLSCRVKATLKEQRATVEDLHAGWAVGLSAHAHVQLVWKTLCLHRFVSRLATSHAYLRLVLVSGCVGEPFRSKTMSTVLTSFFYPCQAHALCSNWLAVTSPRQQER